MPPDELISIYDRVEPAKRDTTEVQSMHRNAPVIPAPEVIAYAGEMMGEPEVELVRLLGTVVSHVDFREDGSVKIKGRDTDGLERWSLTISGSARFTFAHKSGSKSWLVEANFDAGGAMRGSDRTMICAISGALVESFRVEEGGLHIRSDDGRGIEVPLALNEEGLVIEVLPDEVRPLGCRLVLSPA